MSVVRTHYTTKIYGRMESGDWSLASGNHWAGPWAGLASVAKRKRKKNLYSCQGLNLGRPDCSISLDWAIPAQILELTWLTGSVLRRNQNGSKMWTIVTGPYELFWNGSIRYVLSWHITDTYSIRWPKMQ